MRELTRFWNAVAATFPKCADVPLYWRRELGDEHAHASRFLRPNGTIASSYPCPVEHGCSCRHEVVEISDDVCAAIPDDDFRDRCDVVDVPRAEAVLHELDMNSVWAGVADALHVSMMPTPVPWREQCFQLGNLGQARPQYPVYAIVVRDPEVMVNCVLRLMLDNDGPFVVVSPTSRTYGPECDAHIRSRKGLFIALDEHVGMTPDGHWVASPAVLRQIEALRGRETPEPGSPVIAENVFRREGEFWTLSFEGETVHLQPSKGLASIACLLRSPGVELHVAQVLAETAGQADIPVLGSAGEVLTPAALAEYKERIVDLRERIQEAEQHNDLGTRAKCEEELDALTRQLGNAFGLRSRARKASDDAERIRKAVRGNIKRSLDKIKDSHPPLWHHLSQSLQTGYFLAYTPFPTVHWIL
ncbi:MAG TPA: hypothetical protein P5540_08260 [Candidatus Hydrogenedentes bacterium]|nr:hypothetical protein [Candidatus Hydrogenedentota bacterium]